MTLTTAETERQRREREYYDQFAAYHSLAEPSYEPISGKETRPWNPYWRIFQLAQERFTPGARLLDFGCGWGNNAMVFAKIGYDVHGFDISPANIASTRLLAEKCGVADKVHVDLGVAEALEYPADFFDVVVGVDILHHVEVERSLRETYRVLKPGGIALFREPVEQPVFDAVRNTALVRWLFPNGKSFEKHITDDERKLNGQDFKIVRSVFPNARVESFRMLSRLERFGPRFIMPLEKLDMALNRVPGYSWWQGTVIFILEKPRDS
ncbi:MAG: class I SAM-dependent methyltransferase [Blastochloris sp.]|nr:class I SAM-dependent methyltransferase [Blastochloris sp.]